MRHHQMPLVAVTTALVVAALLGSALATSADEIQLAGIRLGQHSLHLLRIYGQPECVIAGAEGAGSVDTAVSGGGGGGGAQGGPGGGGGMGPGAGMGGGMGAGAGMGPGGGGAARTGGAGGGPGGPGGGMGMGMGPGGGGGMGMGAGAGGASLGAQLGGAGREGGRTGAPGGAAGGAAAAGGGGGAGVTAVRYARHQDIPEWAAALITPAMTTKETKWCYRRDNCVVGFVLDRDGYVVAITLAGKKCDWARTAMSEPLRSIKLGDSLQKVINRYGYPQTTNNMGGATGFSRDVDLHYGYGQNVTFQLRDMKVVAITIWEVQLRPVAPVRLPSTEMPDSDLGMFPPTATP
jgi:hypothetical protein